MWCILFWVSPIKPQTQTFAFKLWNLIPKMARQTQQFLPKQEKLKEISSVTKHENNRAFPSISVLKSFNENSVEFDPIFVEIQVPQTSLDMRNWIITMMLGLNKNPSENKQRDRLSALIGGNLCQIFNKFIFHYLQLHSSNSYRGSFQHCPFPTAQPVPIRPCGSWSWARRPRVFCRGLWSHKISIQFLTLPPSTSDIWI